MHRLVVLSYVAVGILCSLFGVTMFSFEDAAIILFGAVSIWSVSVYIWDPIDAYEDTRALTFMGAALTAIFWITLTNLDQNQIVALVHNWIGIFLNTLSMSIAWAVSEYVILPVQSQSE